MEIKRTSGLLEQTLAPANIIQQNLLPEDRPQAKVIGIEGQSICRSEASGDFLDDLNHRDEQLGVVIGNATGL